MVKPAHPVRWFMKGTWHLGIDLVFPSNRFCDIIIGSGGHSRKIECSCCEGYNRNESTYRSFYRTGVSSETPTCGVRVSDAYRISATNLILTLLIFGLNKRWHFICAWARGCLSLHRVSQLLTVLDHFPRNPTGIQPVNAGRPQNFLKRKRISRYRWNELGMK